MRTNRAPWRVVWLVLCLVSCSLAACDDSPPADADADGDSDGDGDADCDSDCDDGRFCNGVETCDPDDPDADDHGCVQGQGDPCLEGQTCDEGQGRCLTECDVTGDADGDGHLSSDCGGDDCDDSDLNRFPGNVEVCDTADHDEDCNPITFGVRDADSDGEPDRACCNVDDSGTRTCGTDCDDTRSTVSPRSPEVCDGFDNNCDDVVDEGVLRTFHPDQDGDGYGANSGGGVTGCTPPPGHVEDATDCDDDARPINPAAAEVCDGRDNDCDGETDPGCACTAGGTQPCGEPDGAGGFVDEGECVVGTQRCIDGLWGECVGDVRPTFEECNGRDDDCDETVDNGVQLEFYPDADGDNYGDGTAAPVLGCAAPARYVLNDTDCDDSTRSRNPGLAEVCDRVHDNDCDPSTNPFDLDGDGFDSRACGGDDCDDGEPVIHPGATERCNAIDDDCDGTIPDDQDRDGFAAAACGGDDCDDLEPTAHPGGVERCLNAIDEDCSGFVDDPIRGEWPGDYEIASPEDLERLVSYTSVAGSILITAPDLIDLEGLECLETVDGDLRVANNPFLESLAGLDGLTSVGGSLSISLNPALASLEGLGGLVTAAGVGTFGISNNASLESLDGLTSLTTVGVMSIGNNPALTSLGDLSTLGSAVELRVSANPALTTLGDLRSLATVAWLVIIGNATLTSLGDLSGLTAIAGSVLGKGGLEIRDNDSLASLDGPSALVAASALIIDGNAALTSLDGLNSLVAVESTEAMLGTIKIQDNDALTTLGLTSLTATRTLEIQFNDSLVDLGGMSNLTTVGGILTVGNNPALTSVAGLSGLESANSILITQNDQLVSLGMASLDTVEYLTIERNASLPAIDGFSALTSIGTGLLIIENASLTSLAGLSGVTYVRRQLSVNGNAALPTCGEIRPLYCRVVSPGWTGMVQIYGNLDDGCGAVGTWTCP